MGLFLYITQGRLPSVGFVHSGLGPPTPITKLPDVHSKAKVKKAIPQLRFSSQVTFWGCARQHSAHTRVVGTWRSEGNFWELVFTFHLASVSTGCLTLAGQPASKLSPSPHSGQHTGVLGYSMCYWTRFLWAPGMGTQITRLGRQGSAPTEPVPLNLPKAVTLWYSSLCCADPQP